ncbi:MAG: hypothetical protein N3B13_11470, partial [Deltaproteobacteria bacterium]|nr:hypothetical protein [Deltaproteobacteria bacterium]
MKKLLISLIFLAGAGIAVYVFAGEPSSLVTICDGKCFQGKSENGPWKAIKAGDKLTGDIYLKTDENSRLE